MTPWRQLILPGDDGSDVTAVKRAFRAMHIRGSGGLIVNRHAGSAFVDVLKTVQRQHKLQVDGKYGKGTHAVVAPHFDLYGVSLYKSAKIRKRTPPEPPVEHLSARDAANELLAFARQGKYHADNPGDMTDVSRTAAGLPVWSQRGYWVHLDPRPLRLLVWLINQGHRIGTFALCSDHHNDGPHGHAGGLAVDISSIDGHSIAQYGSHEITAKVAKLIHDHAASVGLRPDQLISAGAGYVYYSDCLSECIPYSSYYGSDLAGHRNHIHAGYF